MRFHVLGIGSIGTLIAHHLRRRLAPGDRLSLIVRGKYGTVPENPPENLIVEYEGLRSQLHGGFNTEYSDSKKETSIKLLNLLEMQRKYQQHDRARETQKKRDEVLAGPMGETIESLIVTTKTTSTLQALEQCAPRLTPNSTIVLLQNGMGMYESIVEYLFPSPQTRPNFIIASTTHGAWKKEGTPNAHHVVHAGMGEVHFAIVPDSTSEKRDFEKTFWEADNGVPAERRVLSLSDIEDDPPTPKTMENPKYISLRKTVETLLSLDKDLNTSWQPISQLQIRQRQKVTVNASVNPLTALVGCRNGDLLASAYSKGIIRNVCQEASAVFTQVYLRSGSDSGEWLFGGGLASSGGLQALSADTLERETYRIIKKTSTNYSSMLLDMERNRPLEVEFMNGYLSELGKTYNVPTPTIDTLRNSVLLKASLRRLAHLI